MHLYEALLPYPQIDPVLVHIGPLAIRWYALAYIAGLLLGWWLILREMRADRAVGQSALQGQGAGQCRGDRRSRGLGHLRRDPGRTAGLGAVLRHHPVRHAIPGAPYCHGLPGGFVSDPIRIIAAWQGGMSFHGGLIGVAIAVWLFTRRRKLDTLRVGDLVASVAPIGLFFGRIANFINGELWGRPTDVPWAMIFPEPLAGGVPRHPSQLYEAALEGILLFAILQIGLAQVPLARKAGPADRRRVPARLWRVPHLRRALPRTRCAVPRTGHDGPDAVRR